MVTILSSLLELRSQTYRPDVAGPARSPDGPVFE